MPAGRILKYCVALSVLFHLAVALFAALLPVAPRPAEDVVVVEMADLPRAPDFLPPKPGVIEGARPKPPPVPDRPVPKRKPPELPRDVMQGRVPDLPVDARLPAEKEFPARPEPQPPGPKEPPAQSARAAEPPQEAKPAAPANGAPAAEKGGAAKSLRDLTPGLGKTVMAMRERGGGRGRNNSSGSAVGTEAKARPKGEIAEERGDQTADFKPFKGPETRFISYFASIKRKVDLVWTYPYDAMVAGIHGDLVIVFVIGRNGQLERYDLTKSSGHKILDDEAIRSIRAAAPFDPIPTDYDIPNLTVQGHFIYGGVQAIDFFRR